MTCIPFNKPLLRVSLSMLLLSAVTACGTTTPLRINEPPPGEAGRHDVSLVLGEYSDVIVRDFDDAVSGARSTSSKKGQMERAVVDFADLIADAISRRRSFQSVRRSGAATESSLIVTGRITRFDEGSPTLRALIGMGLGSSYFDAEVEITDGGTGELIGSMSVDRNSWPLGGMIAVTQHTSSFMTGAADTVAYELSAAKQASALEVRIERLEQRQPPTSALGTDSGPSESSELNASLEAEGHAESSSDTDERLHRLDRLYEKGLLEEKEYKMERKALLEEL